MDEKLIQFVDHARNKGMDHATIRRLLLTAGWKDKAIADAFCARDLELPIPVAEVAPHQPHAAPRTKSLWPRRARDAFLHLLTYGALYAWVTSLILLCFNYIDFALPDPAERTSQSAFAAARSIIRVHLAVLIVSFPIFLALWHLLLGEVSRDPEKAKGGIRRSLGYLSLFVGAITLSADAVTLIYFLLEGQLTARLLLKTVVLFVVAGSLVFYLALTLRSEAKTEAQP